jgi:isocitrate dehydrogenase
MITKSIRSLATSASRSRLYGGRATSVLIPGDGIGPEMAGHLIRTFETIKAPIDFEVVDLNEKNWSEDNYNNAIMAIKRSGSAIKGNVTTPMNKDIGVGGLGQCWFIYFCRNGRAMSDMLPKKPFPL